MSVLVGYTAAHGGAESLALGALIARSLNLPLDVMSVVLRERGPFGREAIPGRVDDEFAAFARDKFAAAEEKAKPLLAEIAPDVPVHFLNRLSTSPAIALVDGVTEAGADIVVVGSAPGAAGTIALGAIANQLAHSSPVPVAVAPNGFRANEGATVSRVTAAYDGTTENGHVVAEAASLASDFKAPLRVATFGVRGGTMFPPEVGLSSPEDDVLNQWREQMSSNLTKLRAQGVVADGVDTAIATGETWPEAFSAVDWSATEVLCVGTKPQGAIKRVFLGSKGARLLTSASVPVLLLPA